MKHLDVGCGSNPRNPFNRDQLYGIDIIETFETNYTRIVPNDAHAYYGRQVVEKDPDNFVYVQGNAVLEPLPFDSDFFDSLSAYDFIEHIPRVATNGNSMRFPFIDFMNEAYRVLKPGGVFYALTPCYPQEVAFVDPTHVNFITENTHEHFTLPELRAHIYGFAGKFEVVRVERVIPRIERREKTTMNSFKKHLYNVVRHGQRSYVAWELKAIK